MDDIRRNEFNLFINKGEYNTALLRAKRMTSSDSNDDELLALIGQLSIRCNNYVEADYYFGQACSINPNNVDAIAGSLLCSIALNRTIEKEILFDRIKLCKDESALLAKSAFHKSNNSLIQEMDTLTEAHSLYPESVDIIEKLVDAKIRNNSDDASVLQLLEKGLLISPNNESLIEQKLKYLYRTGNYEACIKFSKQITRRFPNKTIAQSAQAIHKRINNEARKKATQQQAPDNMNSRNKNSDSSAQLSAQMAFEELDRLVGLNEVKQQVYTIKKKLDYDRMRAEKLGITTNGNDASYHFIFSGNPGTGKTTVARLMGAIFKDYGILEKGQLIEASRVDLVSQFVGGTAIKTQQLVDKALGGVLFIDEAYSIINGDNDAVGHEALDTLVKNIEDHRNEFIVILAGYRKEMEDLLKENSGLESRFRHIIQFPDYNDEELFEIAQLEGEKNSYTFTPEGKIAFMEKINKKKIDAKFGNARAVRNLIADAMLEKAKNYNPERDGEEYFTTFQPKDFGIDILLNPEDRIKKSLEKLNGLQGLKSVKNEVETMISIASYIKNSTESGTITPGNLPVNLNMVFVGNPGTGKTTVARIYAELLAGLGLLKKGHMVEVTRSDLVGMYMGHTAKKTKELCEHAYGGVLFIDEAYSLVLGGNGNDSFGQEAISTLLTEMENNRDKLVVILAGYSKEMSYFMDTNSGLQSRIGKTIAFEDYSESELCDIFAALCASNHITVSDDAQKGVAERIHHMYCNKDSHFGNAREIRNLYEDVWKNMVKRVEHNNLIEKERTTFIACDVPEL